jgi:hypothetical protein
MTAPDTAGLPLNDAKLQEIFDSCADDVPDIHLIYGRAVIRAAQAAQPERKPLSDAEIAVRSAVHSYYGALNRREHGGLAMDRAFNAIEKALGMHWVQTPIAHGIGEPS